MRDEQIVEWLEPELRLEPFDPSKDYRLVTRTVHRLVFGIVDAICSCGRRLEFWVPEGYLLHPIPGCEDCRRRGTVQ